MERTVFLKGRSFNGKDGLFLKDRVFAYIPQV